MVTNTGSRSVQIPRKKIITHFRRVLDAQLSRFLLVGGIFCLLGVVLLYVFVQLTGMNYLVGYVIAFFILNFFSYLLNRYYVFNGRFTVKWGELTRYYLVMLFSLGVNLVLMYLLVDILGINYLVATMGVAVLLALFNYVAHLRVSFRNGKF